MPLRIEEGLTEWQVPSLLVDTDGKRTYPRSAERLKEIFPDAIDLSYRSVNPVGPDVGTEEGGCAGDDDDDGGDDVTGVCPRFEETEEDLLKRCETTMRRILGSVGGDSFAVVSHAPCNQALAHFLRGPATPGGAGLDLGPWALGGITLFSRDNAADPWNLEFYSDSSHMPGDYSEGVKGQWSLPGFVRI